MTAHTFLGMAVIAVRSRSVMAQPTENSLAPMLSTRGSIRWDLIAQQYDQMIRYATAITNRIASTEALIDAPRKRSLVAYGH